MIRYSVLYKCIAPESDGNADKSVFDKNIIGLFLLDLSNQQSDCIGSDIYGGVSHELIAFLKYK